MNYNMKLLSIILIVVLLQSVILIPLIPLVKADSNGDTEDSNYSWLRGILMVLLSFLVNNFVNEGEEDTPGEKLEEIPLVEEKDANLKREVLGFYTNWLTPESNPYQSLTDNWQNMEYLAPFWYTLEVDGTLNQRYGGHQYEVVSLAKKRGLKVLPLINNSQQNNMMLVDPKIRTKSVNNIVDMINTKGYDGVNIDFEFLPTWSRQGYTSFIRELSRKLKRHDKILTISVFPKIDVPLELQGAYDYAALGPHVDRIVIMTYDHHWSTGPAGPIAPLDWVEKNIEYTLEYIPSDKVLLGIANYGYDWASRGIATDISLNKALKQAAERGVNIRWHDKYQSPYYFYRDDSGHKHEVWFENSYSLEFKLDLVNEYDLAGIAIWRLGNAPDRFWHNIQKKLR